MIIKVKYPNLKNKPYNTVAKDNERKLINQIQELTLNDKTEKTNAFCGGRVIDKKPKTFKL